jgi:carbamoyl-phosphate synthase large subunit
VDTYLGPEMKSTGEVMGIDYDFGGALVKALVAAGLALPPDGSILLSIADRDKRSANSLIRKLSKVGYRLYATEGTSEVIRAAGLEVTMIRKKISEGHPNVIDIIHDGQVDAVVNTTSGGHVPMRDGFMIRRAAAEQRIPCYTSIDTARVAVESLISQGRLYSVLPLPEYLNKTPV